MKRYFYLQLKRSFKLFPFVLAVTLALFVGLSVILTGIVGIFSGGEENSRFKIAITGDTESEYIKWGMTAMRTFDETRFAMEFIEMTEDDAERAIAVGDISAYVVLPENFIEKALSGQVDPIKYVTTAGVGGVVSMFKNEITQLVTDMVIYSEKGSYAIYDAMADNGQRRDANKYMNMLSLEYVELIFGRSGIYTLEELGVTNGLSTAEYFICGITILLLMLIGLPYIIVHIKRDCALSSLLLSRGYSNFGQLLCEYLSHLAAMLALIGVIFAALGVGAHIMPEAIGNHLTLEALLSFALRLVPAVVMLAAFNIMIFELSDNLVSGVLLHFFASISLCYISGCMYPIYAFPKAVQKMAVFLPTGVTRGYLSGWFTDSTLILELAGVLAYAVLFFGIALAVRARKTANKRG